MHISNAAMKKVSKIIEKKKALIEQTLLSSIMLVIMMIILYSAVGRTNLQRSWYFSGLW
jgi:hypothetical protein